MTKLVSLSEDVYEELNRIRVREGKSFSEVIRELLRYRYLDMRGLVELIERIGPIEVEEVEEEVWEGIPRRAGEAWRSA